MALETEQVGSGILNDLRNQRETLVHTRDNVNQFPVFICDNLLMVGYFLVHSFTKRMVLLIELQTHWIRWFVGKLNSTFSLDLAYASLELMQHFQHVSAARNHLCHNGNTNSSHVSIAILHFFFSPLIFLLREWTVCLFYTPRYSLKHSLSLVIRILFVSQLIALLLQRRSPFEAESILYSRKVRHWNLPQSHSSFFHDFPTRWIHRIR